MSDTETNPRKVRLRILETTDIHANLLPYDYYANRDGKRYGLARTATLIEAARAESDNCLLLDTGDYLQGTPLGELATRADSGWSGPHPAIAAMNFLGYDAAGLGNHEFNFGLDVLMRNLRDARFPVICANVAKRLGPTPDADDTLVPPYVILDREVTDESGRPQQLRIGILGLLPPQVTTWDQFVLRGAVHSRDMVETARAYVPRLQAEGADLIIALAHTGIDDAPARLGMENAALQLAALDGIDAILAGHSHQVFPSQDLASIPGANVAAGTLSGTPAVMAGFRGSHLGVLDLDLVHADGRWRITAHKSEARPVSANRESVPVAPAAALLAALAPAHDATLKLARQPIGFSDIPLHSYLTHVSVDRALHLVTCVQRDVLKLRLIGTPYEDLPILSVSAPFKTGGRAGPSYFTDVPAGPLYLRNAADLYVFPNLLCALRVNGAEIADWLERAVIGFHQIMPGEADQPLWDPSVPGHAFDVIDGLTYRIDLSQPPRYDPNGMVIHPGATRITDLCRNGLPLSDDDEFIIAANSFRALGGGPFRRWDDDRFVHKGRVPLRDHLISALRDQIRLSRPIPDNWSFRSLPGATVTLETGPGVRAYPEDLERIGAEDLGDTETGFARLRLAL